MISAGLVGVDGRRAILGARIDVVKQRVTVSGVAVRPPVPGHVVLVLNKPAGVVTTMKDERKRASVADFAPPGRRLFPVGRLDADSTGLLLLTSDGELGRRLSHPSFGLPKRYRIRVAGSVGDSALQRLGSTGMVRRFEQETEFEITLREGKNRQIRRMCAHAGIRVIGLTRIGFGPLSLGDLKPGKVRTLTAQERAALARAVQQEQASCRAAGCPLRSSKNLALRDYSG
ncbi:MAG: rRNA pseudouridine synthase [Candidatus Eremiobacteraeota bacterium]|nr:rRNA pseudouridine synthase [Candidatus Eremiobacteraeota bacterium]MBC5826501.1 rRNA pseudouridine synthase [Candidatus Eremiobacteraeota bacterium]